MTQFTDDDVKLMESGGNGPHNALYMARYVPGKDMPIPNGNDSNRMKEFIKLKYDKKWYSADGVSNIATDFNSNSVSGNGGRMSVSLPSSNQTRKSIGGGGGGGMDLLDMLDAAPAPSVFSPSGQHNSSFNAFNGSSSTSSQGFDAFGGAPVAGGGGGNQNAFGAFGSAPETAVSNNSFDAFGATSQPTQNFDNFGQQMNFQQPQVQQQQPMGFGQQGYMNQGQSMGAGFNSNFGQPAAPMVFIKTAPPAPAPALEPVAIAAPPKPVIPGFSAFDDLVIEAPAPTPVPVPNSANPFDMVSAAGPQHNPFGGAPAGYPPQQQQFQNPGYPPQQQFQNPGYPPQQQFQNPGYPPQHQFQNPGYPPQQQYGMPGYPPQQQPPGAQFQNPGVYPPHMAAVPPQQQPVAPVPAPVAAPAAPDPFSSFAGLAFETVGKAAPPRSSITSPPTEIPSASLAIPTPAAPPAAVSANPFDMF
jgi:hypothetical protein